MFGINVGFNLGENWNLNLFGKISNVNKLYFYSILLYVVVVVLL